MAMVREKGLVLRKGYDLPANAAVVRVVLEEQTYGAVGSLSIPVKR